MGNYTELTFGANFKKNTPKEVIDTLRYMAGDTTEKPESLAFESVRNPLYGGSQYFGVSKSVTKMYYDEIDECWALSSRANIKNYDDDIERFLEWVKPYINDGSGDRDMYAIVIYAEDSEPTIYYLND